MSEPPLDPNSPKGREVAERLTQTLGDIEFELATREAARPTSPIGDTGAGREMRRAPTD